MARPRVLFIPMSLRVHNLSIRLIAVKLMTNVGKLTTGEIFSPVGLVEPPIAEKPARTTVRIEQTTALRFVNRFRMFTRHHKPLAHQAVIWLMAVLFALPLSFLVTCPCSASDCDTCPRQSVARDSAGCDVCLPTSPQTAAFPFCGCPDDCPCRCNNDRQQPVQPVVSYQDSQDDLAPSLLLTEAIGVVDVDSHAMGASCSPTAAANSALERCISLSRLTL